MIVLVAGVLLVESVPNSRPGCRLVMTPGLEGLAVHLPERQV